MNISAADGIVHDDTVHDDVLGKLREPVMEIQYPCIISCIFFPPSIAACSSPVDIPILLAILEIHSSSRTIPLPFGIILHDHIGLSIAQENLPREDENRDTT